MPAPDRSMATLTELQRQYLKEELGRKMQQAKSTLRHMGEFRTLSLSLKDYYMHMQGHIWLIEGLITHKIDPVALQ